MREPYKSEEFLKNLPYIFQDDSGAINFDDTFKWSGLF